ncbi:unnamed protein product [Clonostachys chloroleuca]|uniref:Major facilitator superfamily (MFS) profile domain-containing protein n=1 Tax=Clonostachys chloroleuca TaxID=1926264 RepID=A0AA35MFQ3_9HYPO|nr:unnamed protein product [Clonostachys chloroleuca]
MMAESPTVTPKEAQQGAGGLVEVKDAQTSPSKTEPNQTVTGTTDTDGDNDDDEKYLRGWRLWIVTAGMWISLFLSTLETTIVSTSLISITDALSGFLLRDWVVTAYLLTYTGFLTIFAKVSDLFGKKTMLLVALAIFTIFSALCGASNDIVTLIIFRAFQGIGASGIYSMVLVLAPTLVPVRKYGKYMAIVATVFLIASVLGPVLGGVINAHSSWRWVFLLNIPGGAVAFITLAVFLPMSDESSQLSMKQIVRSKFRLSIWARLDMLGMSLLLAFSVLLIFALEEAGTRYPWRSPAIIAPLALAVALTIGFIVWEIYVERSASRQEPVFPPSICKDRLPAALLLSAFFIGFPFVSIIVNLPQRAQAVYGKSAFEAGISMLPLLLASPVATALAGFLTGRAKVPLFYILVVSGVFQLVGVGLTCGLPTNTTTFPRELYAYEAIMGFGFGLGLSTLLILARLVVSKENLPVMMGAATQVRVLGGTISLAICATMLNNYVKPKLSELIDPAEAAAVLESLSEIQTLTELQQIQVRRAFSEGYNQQNIFMTALTGVGFVTTCFLWERHPRRAE